MTKSKFIVVEGIDGCGSSTQAKMLVDRLNDRGIPTILTCEPSQGFIGRALRQNLKGELLDPRNDEVYTVPWDTSALLFAADRLDHVQRVIAPALAAGKWVVSDRYTFSSLTYQSITAGVPEGVALDWISALNKRALQPDLTIIVNASADVAEARRASRGGKPELYETTTLQRRLAGAYSSPDKYGLLNYTKVNGELTISGTFEEVWGEVVSNLLG